MRIKSNHVISAIGACLVFPTMTMAGIPTQETMTCPIGGESFEVTETLSCSTMGYKMSLAQVTSCDFVTVIPQCPTNGLPLYKEFSEEDLERLKAYIETDGYAALKGQSRFYLAYKIEQFLDGSDKAEEFWLLLQGLWDDTDSLLKDDDYMQLLRAASVEGAKALGPESEPYYLAMMVYFNGLSGQKTLAQEQLAQMKLSSEMSQAFFADYVAAIEACLTGENTGLCDPNALIPEN